MMKKSNEQNNRIQKIIAVLLLLALWQAVAMAVGSRLLIASPLQVLKRLYHLLGEPGFLKTVWFSFSHIAGGFFLALFSGCFLAVLAGKHAWIEILLAPFMVTIKTVPVASFIIIALIWLSSKNISVFISFLMVLPVIYNNVLGGIKNTDPKMTEMAEVFRISWARKLRYIWIPSIQPYLFTACSVALGMAWKAGVAAEVIGIPAGSIGEELYSAKAYLMTEDLFAWTVIIVLISVTFEKLVLWLLGKIYAWYCH